MPTISLLFILSIHCSMAAEPIEPAMVVEVARDLVHKVGADEDGERAVFLAIEEGAVRVIEWPNSHGYRISAWRGPIPPTAVAIVHTHPITLPMPSTRDRLTAQSLCMPVIVATKRSLCRAQPDGTFSCSGL